ncbi:hypothetical protein EXIGLDRAFT_754505 [Exidia glandulosa HHB12029]|uniref:MYND-type domain-containing protein n=1 Tax=Exidia glandulosa HHB12029 TaxID=1314781 RepID=A0A165CW94_EXIGL|nr:hypothetical protein EXIGLDRAFT_754505 [Exidia glandulosa HHB12029]
MVLTVSYLCLLTLMHLSSDEVSAHVQMLAHLLGLNDYNSFARAALATSAEATRAIDTQIRRINAELGKSAADSIFSTFCALHLHKLFAAYKATPDESLVTPYTIMMGAVVDKGQFVRFTRTPQGRELFRIQMRRFSGRGLPRRIEEIRNMAQLFNFFVVHTYYDQNMVAPMISPSERQRLLDKAEAYRRLCYEQVSDPSAKATFAILSETVDFLQGRQNPSKMLGAYGATMPLQACGDVDSQCWATGTRATLHCSTCESVRYCGPAHQRSHWHEHRTQCVRPVWL